VSVQTVHSVLQALKIPQAKDIVGWFHSFIDFFTMDIYLFNTQLNVQAFIQHEFIQYAVECAQEQSDLELVFPTQSRNPQPTQSRNPQEYYQEKNSKRHIMG
jgi:hypothetical protein